MNNIKILDRWTKENSEDLYNIKNWSANYFSISKTGEVMVNPEPGNEESAVSIMDIIKGVSDRGMDMPVLLRFENLLDAQISYLNTTFKDAMKELDYKGQYRGVYPIKVNQEQQVIEEVAKYGQRYHHGFEVGSKAELIAALSKIKDKEACLICNGYKDEEFINLGLYAVKMGFNCFFVIEMPGELELIVNSAKELGVKPNIGVRIKLSSSASGHWTESSGDRSIFGLSISQLTNVIDSLKENNMLDCLKLLHYHLGSQIPNIRNIRSAILEAARVYVELVEEGAPMGYLDLGGGLAVDYDGSNTNYASSRNYSVKEYCVDLVEAVMLTLDRSGVTHPTIITESGRWLVAYYSILIFNVLDVNRFEKTEIPDKLDDDICEAVQNLHEANLDISPKNIQECYNDALYYRDQIRDLFKQGEIGLRERSLSEKIFWNSINRITEIKKKIRFAPAELEDIERAISDIYYCNFSVFQSLPDSWAIDQLFPIMPIHRLDEHPIRNAVIADITCDSDGKIDRFIDSHEIRKTLPLHELKENEEYYLGAFLVGAYQETLGDLHNLFGDTNVVSVRISENGDFDLASETPGDTVADVLSYVKYDLNDIRKHFQEIAEKAVSDKRITPKQRSEIMKSFDDGLSGYTYYEK